MLLLNKELKWLLIAALVAGVPATAAAQNAPPPPPPPPPSGDSGADVGGSFSMGTSQGTEATTTTTTTTTSPTFSQPTTTQPVNPPPQPPPVNPAAVQTAPVVPTANEGTDHDRVVGDVGIGLLSTAQLQVLSPGPGYVTTALNVPVVGFRHWMSDGMGLDLGVGVNTTSGTLLSNITIEEDVDSPTIWGLALHAGLPISLYDGEHYNFVMIPELNLGFATGRTKDDANVAGDQAVRHHAWLLSGGLRLGAEIQFGMIDLPMLALQGTVGASMSYRYASVSAAEQGTVVTRAQWSLDASTASYNDPWDLFTGSIAALYYFE